MGGSDYQHLYKLYQDIKGIPVSPMLARFNVAH